MGVVFTSGMESGSGSKLSCGVGLLRGVARIMSASGVSRICGRMVSVDNNPTRTGVSVLLHHFDSNASRTRCQRRWPSSGNLLNHFLAGDARRSQLDSRSTFSRLVIDGQIFASMVDSQFVAFSAMSGSPVK